MDETTCSNGGGFKLNISKMIQLIFHLIFKAALP